MGGGRAFLPLARGAASGRVTRKLSIVHTEASCGWGGQEIRVLTEAEGLIGRGHRVALVAPPAARICEAARQRGIPVTTLPIEEKTFAALRAMRRWLAANRSGIDVINTHSSIDSWLVAGARATLTGAPPMVRTRHVSSPVRKTWGTFWLYQHATAHIVTTGEALREQLHRDNGYALDSMTSVPTGIDLTRFRPMDSHAARAALGLPDRPTIGIVATLRNWKGHMYLLDAFASLATRHREAQLVIVGDGPQRANIERRVAELDLADAVRIAGQQEDVPIWLGAMDVFALPSYGDEGVPQAIMQAMACARPVVSTGIGATAEAVVDGETGTLVAPKNAEALAAALERLMNDAALRDRYGAAALVRARERFGLGIMLDRMETVFERYARRTRSTA